MLHGGGVGGEMGGWVAGRKKSHLSMNLQLHFALASMV
jgi:hypothetical protein